MGMKCSDDHNNTYICQDIKDRELWDINLCTRVAVSPLKERGGIVSNIIIYPSSIHNLHNSRTYNILLALLNNDISKEIFSYLWDFKLMPCKSFEYGYYELCQLYLEDYYSEYMRIVREREEYPSKSEMSNWNSYESDYYEEIMYTVDCIEESLYDLIKNFKKFTITAFNNGHWKILQMIFNNTPKYIDNYSDWYIIDIWVKILYLSTQSNYNKVCNMVIPLLNKYIKLCRGGGKDFDLDATIIKDELTQEKIKKISYNVSYCILFYFTA